MGAYQESSISRSKVKQTYCYRKYGKGFAEYYRDPVLQHRKSEAFAIDTLRCV